jgi:hypothetical protein
MITGDRLPDPDFATTEVLVQRCKKCHLEDQQPDARPAAAAFPSPIFSLNRTKFGPSEDVLIPASKYGSYGFFTYQVNQIPSAVAHDGDEYSFQLNHLPVAENYHHCHIHTCRAGEPLPENRKPPKAVDKYFRTVLARRAVLRRQPQI